MTIRHFPLPESAEAAKPRLGLLVPATDHISELAFLEMLAGSGVDFLTNRVALANPITMENLARMIDDVSRATASLLPDGRIDAIAFSCTSGTAAVGPDKVAQAIHAARPGMPFTTPITAAVKACKQFGLNRVAVLTPYVDEVNEPIRRFLERNGVAVAAFGSFHLLTEPEIASVPPAAIVEAGRALDAPGIDAVFVSCTGMRGHQALDRLEAATGKPCLTSNQVQLWDALSLIGYGRPIRGFGSMLARLGTQRRGQAAD
ncbi:MAG: aspartate/glutamate racemase family protein [Alphaproteobacteria bacterium]|nr:aspartate/glutamate racemase family protein [Alphaproteobacteria bacterium]